MVLPALFGAFATLGAGALGAGAADRAAAYNYQVDLLNYYSREQERRDAIQAASRQERRTDKQIAESKLGTTDAQGNRVQFIPGQGWVTTLADDQQQLQDLYQNEELAQLLQDLPKKREVLNQNVIRQRGEDTTANALLNAFGRIDYEDPREIENQLNQASSMGITKGYDDTLREAMRGALRTGSAPGKISAEIGKARASSLQDAFMNNKINARGQSEENVSRKQANLANLYNMFATRASSMPDVAYNPRNIEGITAAQQGGAMSGLAGTQGLGQNSAGALINAFAKQGGSMNPIEPNYGWANAVQSGGTALAEAFQSMGDERARMAALGSYGDYSGFKPQDMFKQNRGSW